MRVNNKLLTAFRRNEKFLIAAHISPDGDAIGSALALSSALESLGKRTFLYSRDPVPAYFAFLPGIGKFTYDIGPLLTEKPVLVLVDCNSPERAGLEQYSFERSIVIDHHETERDFGDVKWVERESAATGLMVFSLIKALGAELDKDMATNLFAAISVDTGSFRYGNTSSEALRACAELIEAGAEPGRLADLLYESWDRRRFHLLVEALNTLDIRDHVAMIHVTRKMLKKTGTSAEDTENFSNFPRMIGSVKISALLREVDRGAWKASLRSRGETNVAEIAEVFGGGGHRNAAGFRISGGLKTVKETLLKQAVDGKKKAGRH